VTVIDQVKDVVTGRRVFGDPYEKNGVTVIPTARVRGGGGGGDAPEGDGTGGGGGGFGLDATPVGAFVIKGDEVTWVPAVDVTRIVVGLQLVAIIALLSWRSVAKARSRR
jgi:uncharacterized spore protein YtfJ